jgi:hypothetical protein
MFTKEQGYDQELGAGKVRREIYAIEFRKPFGLDVDSEPGLAYFGDQGPTATSFD